MSYEIVYDKQFIKLKDNLFVPMLFWGSNNCTEWHNGRERRARNWSVWDYISGGDYASKETLLANCEKLRQDKITQNTDYRKDNEDWDEYNDKNFGYWTSIAIGGSTHNTTYGMFKGLFNTGCRKALTIEQLKEENINVWIKSYTYKDEAYKENGLEYRSKEILSGEDYIATIKEFREYYKGDNGISVHISMSGASEWNMKRIRKKYFPRKKKTYVEPISVDEYYTIKVADRYFVKKIKSGYSYTHYPYLKYKTKKEAEKRISRYNNPKYKVELIKEKARI